MVDMLAYVKVFETAVWLVERMVDKMEKQMVELLVGQMVDKKVVLRVYKQENALAELWVA